MSFWMKIGGFNQQKYQESLNKITLEKIEKGMEAYKFPANIKADLLTFFHERVRQQGINEFRLYMYNLPFTVPQEIENERIAKALYEENEAWFEAEINNLEDALQLTFEVQSEDLNHLHVAARKVQLVIRHRLSEITLDIADNKF